MAIPESHPLIQHYIDLDVEFIARVIGVQGLDVADGLGEAHGEVEEEGGLLGGRGGAGEVGDVGGGGAGPVDDDEEGEDEAAEGVEVPGGGVETDCIGGVSQSWWGGKGGGGGVTGR